MNRYDIGVEPNTVFGEYDRKTKTLFVVGEENKEMDKVKFWKFVASNVKGADFDYGRVCFDYYCNNLQYTVNIRDKIALPTDSSDLFRLWQTNLIINPCVHTENVTDMRCMFESIDVAINIDVSKWDVSNVTNMSRMFGYTEMVNPDVSDWDVSNVEDMSGMFVGSEHVNPDVSNWDVGNVKYMSWMFAHVKNANLDVSKWNVENVVNMNCMFYDCEKARPDISKWNTKNLEEMAGMFMDTGYTPDISHLNLTKVIERLIS